MTQKHFLLWPSSAPLCGVPRGPAGTESTVPRNVSCPNCCTLLMEDSLLGDGKPDHATLRRVQQRRQGQRERQQGG